ncbi:MAG: hypothetical protein D6726_09560, partial [Nitrospirae bacterium]
EPEDPTHYVKLGDFYQKTHNDEAPARAFQKAAELYRAEGALAKAVCAYKKVQQIKPYDITIQKKLTECMLELKESQFAEKTVHCKVEKRGVTKEELIRELMESDCLPPLFKENPELRDMLYEAKLVDAEEGQVLIKEGDRSRSVFIILRGTVKIFITIGGKDMDIAKLGPGDIFGEMAFITGNPRSATVVSSSPDLMALELEQPLLEKMVDKEPVVLKYLYDIYKARKSD